MNNTKANIEAEIKASKKKQSSINVRLVKEGEMYKAFLPFKIEGDYILSASSIDECSVSVEWNKQGFLVINDLESELTSIDAVLSKDTTVILAAIAKNIKDTITVEPSFIVGPPGTGKTFVIVKLLKEALAKNKRILVASSTNMAVENILERIDLDELGLKDGEVVSTIKTELKSLQSLSIASIVERKLSPIMDEIEILKDTKSELHENIRDLSPYVQQLSSKLESENTLVINLEKKVSTINESIKKHNIELDLFQVRIDALTSNSFMKSITNTFMSKKLETLNSDKKEVSNKIEILETECSEIKIELDTFKSAVSDTSTKLKDSNLEISEINNTIKKIKDRLEILDEKQQQLKSNDIISSAKIVGATLVSAALNKKIQNGEFDIVIVDEASMCLVPTIVSVSQTIKVATPSEVTYKDDEKLYAAQNDAVRMSMKSQLVLVGDPRQLSPIAQTYEMKKSIFDKYDVNDIFEGIEVKNTVFLDTNFRNHPSITAMASKLFYGGLLKSGKKVDGSSSLYIRRSTSLMVSFEQSYVNQGNAQVIKNQVLKALEKGRRSIGIITPYKKQAELITETLSDLLLEYPDADIQAGTVHKFQGKEKDIIIYDITFSPNGNMKIPATYQGDNTSETAKLLNVAMTRAESLFILVGNIDGILNMRGENLVLKTWTKEIVTLIS